ncbi:MAG: hypothetical protein A2992_02625 [Elusimicrobia bacterium RIFCSPLOWO2_01_FULL_59_12]|nr:MAG: hypothetical protein A2992_02625 [Elusimicrobia bacterium RIFCSPLOWO2_01_FULL_59_12]
MIIIPAVVSGNPAASTTLDPRFRGDDDMKGDEATITSDHMELINHGEKTIFDGHVVLQRPPYELKAKRMTRAQGTGHVDVEGQIVATWVSPEGGQVRVQGDRGRYDPNTEKAELWTNPSRKVKVDWKDEQGSARFYSARAEFEGATRKVRLVNHVTGHVVPAPR